MATNLMQFDPFSGIARMDPFRNIEDIFRDFAMMPGLRTAPAVPQIRMDVAETDSNYIVKADIPGVQKENIKVAINGNQVSLSAEMKDEKETNSAGILRSERSCGQQYRSFTLPQEVDDAGAEARYENGVLELTLPKKHGSGAKQLLIQ